MRGFQDLKETLGRLEDKVDLNSSKIRKIERHPGPSGQSSSGSSNKNQDFSSEDEEVSVDLGYSSVFTGLSPSRTASPGRSKPGPCTACYQSTVALRNASKAVHDMELRLKEVRKTEKESALLALAYAFKTRAAELKLKVPFVDMIINKLTRGGPQEDMGAGVGWVLPTTDRVLLYPTVVSNTRKVAGGGGDTKNRTNWAASPAEILMLRVIVDIAHRDSASGAVKTKLDRVACIKLAQKQPFLRDMFGQSDAQGLYTPHSDARANRSLEHVLTHVGKKDVVVKFPDVLKRLKKEGEDNFAAFITSQTTLDSPDDGEAEDEDEDEDGDDVLGMSEEGEADEDSDSD
ncbi:hypothetical protein TrRE_jg8378 [Triparma retinervis]|uniref:Uncharacterized protein n=1 Tax=Triparma retinervis TaxID=2557542 RepID=A0A9W7A4F2_9STRA|nr:hypothetical protein TrRE_jg8378 [Triparma retinervis]